MFDHLPKKLITEREIISLATTPGAILGRLPDLFQALKRGKETAKIYLDLERRLLEKYQRENELVGKFFTWVVDCLGKLTQSLHAVHPSIKPKLEKLQEIILAKVSFDKDCDQSTWSLKDVALGILKDATDAVAQFGPDKLFDGWAVVKPTTAFVYRDTVLAAFPDDESLVEFLDKQDRQKGKFYELCFPSAVQQVFEENYKSWMAKRDSDIVVLYEFLKFLSLPSDKSFLEIFPSRYNTFINLYHCGQAEQELALCELRDLIDRFLQMIESQLCTGEQVKGGKLKAQLYVEACAYIRKELGQHVRALDEEDRNKFSNKNARQYLIDRAKFLKLDPELVEAITVKAVEAVTCFLRKELATEGIKWVVAGRPRNENTAPRKENQQH